MTVYQAVRQFGEQNDADTDTETPLGKTLPNTHVVLFLVWTLRLINVEDLALDFKLLLMFCSFMYHFDEVKKEPRRGTFYLAYASTGSPR